MYADYILTLHARTFTLTMKAAYHCCVFSNDNSETVQCKECQHFGGGGEGRERQGEEVRGRRGREKTEDILNSILSRFH